MTEYTIVNGILVNTDNQFLMLRKTKYQLFEFPGGKAYGIETLAQALQRELREELNVDVSIGRNFGSSMIVKGTAKLTIHYFHASVLGYELPQMIDPESDDMQWINSQNVSQYKLQPEAERMILVFEAYFQSHSHNKKQ